MYSVALLDIEGTTTPISFVHDVLFPYIKTHVQEYVQSNWGSSELQAHVSAIRADTAVAPLASTEGVVEVPLASDAAHIQQKLVENVLWQMKHDFKTKGLKGLQGLMWKDAYEAGLVKGLVYDDVLEAFEWWKQTGVSMYIYSSGSVPAQKLLFGYSTKGDLLPYLSGHFDTTIGPKVEASSYTAIAQAIGKPEHEILFVTDNVKGNFFFLLPSLLMSDRKKSTEARAAKLSNFQVAVTDRPGNAPLSEQDRHGICIKKKYVFFSYDFLVVVL